LLDEILFLYEGRMLLKDQVENLKQTRNQSLFDILKGAYAGARL